MCPSPGVRSVTESGPPNTCACASATLFSGLGCDFNPRKKKVGHKFVQHVKNRKKRILESSGDNKIYCLMNEVIL